MEAQPRTAGIRSRSFAVMGLLLLVGLALGGLGGFLVAESRDEPESDVELLCASLETLPGDPSFQDLLDEGIGPQTHRLTAVAGHAMASDDEDITEAGTSLTGAVASLDAEGGDKALEELRAECD